MAVDKLVDSTQLNADLTLVANAIRTKGGTSAQLSFPNGFVSAIGDIPTGGTLITKTITENGTYDAEDDDADGYSEVTVNVSGETTIEDGLVSGNLSGAYENSRVTKAKFALFRGCKSITSLKLPNITAVPNQCCYQATSLTVFSAVNATSSGGDVIYGCTSLKTVAIPKVNDIEANTYNNCSALETIDIKGGIIRANAFNNDPLLSTVIIRHTSVPNLVVTSAFDNTPFKSGGSGGTIYIPQSLYDHLGDGSSSDYKSKTNWASIDARGTITWAKIEGSKYENYYADGTPIT